MVLHDLRMLIILRRNSKILSTASFCAPEKLILQYEKSLNYYYPANDSNHRLIAQLFRKVKLRKIQEKKKAGNQGLFT